MADQENVVVFLCKTYGFQVDLRDQRTGGINGMEAAFDGGLTNRRGNAMRAVKDMSAFGSLA